MVEKFDVINKSLASVVLKKNLSLDSTHNLTVAQVSTGFLSGGQGGGDAENSILHVNQFKFYKSINDTINGKLCLCENSPRFHQFVSNKSSKIKISRGSIPPDPLLCHMLCT